MQHLIKSLKPFIVIGEYLIESVIYHPDKSLINDLKTSRKLAIELLDDVGIIDPAIRFDCYPHEFSGGQRQRIAIGRALATRPEFIVADEPVSALDVTIQAQILDLLMALGREHNLTMLFVSHAMAVIRHIAHRVLVMYHGKVVEAGPVTQVFNQPKAPYTQSLLASIPGAAML